MDLEQENKNLKERIVALEEKIKLYEISTKLDYLKIEKLKEIKK